MFEESMDEFLFDNKGKRNKELPTIANVHYYNLQLRPLYFISVNLIDWITFRARDNHNEEHVVSKQINELRAD